MSGEYIKGRPRGIKCLAEKFYEANPMFRLVHDGSEGDSRFYTKIYRLFTSTLEHPKGEYLNTFVRFRYDLRNNWADLTITYNNILELEKVWDKQNGEEQCQQNQPGQPSGSIVS